MSHHDDARGAGIECGARLLAGDDVFPYGIAWACVEQGHLPVHVHVLGLEAGQAIQRVAVEPGAGPLDRRAGHGGERIGLHAPGGREVVAITVAHEKVVEARRAGT